MRVRRTGLATIGAALSLAALVAVIGSAQAAPSTKIYDATVRVVAGPTTTLQLNLTNAAGSKQTLGSANFTAPPGVMVVDVDEGSITDPDFTVAAVGNVVQFRSTVALKRTESVSANVQVSTTSSCTDATWIVEGKQSNDFSGTGNDFLPGSSTNVRPLGSLAIADVGTEVDDPDTPEEEEAFVPQILVSVEEPLAVSAKDICGAAYTNYGLVFGADATLVPKPATPLRLVDATLTQPAWTAGTGTGAGTGTATLEPVDVETGDELLLSDDFTDIEATSNVFDVVEKLCTYFDDTCEWSNENGRIHANAPAPPGPSGDDVPSLGIGFTDEPQDLDVLNFSCNADESPAGSTLININPRDYPDGATVTVTLTYERSETGNGPASSFTFCMSKNDGLDWFPVEQCTSTPQPPCILDQSRVTGGALELLLLIAADDPWGGLS